MGVDENLIKVFESLREMSFELLNAEVIYEETQ